MTEIPAGFVLEDELPAQQEGIAPPPGFVVEGAQPSKEGRSGADIVEDVIRSLASGASLGLADEFAAFMSSLTGFGGLTEGGTYEEEIAAQRARDVEIPASVAIPAEIVGGVGSAIAAGPAVAARAAAALPARAVQFAKELPGWAKAAGFGGLYGGAYGFGTAEGGIGERARGAGAGAALGSVAGGLGYPVVKGLQFGAGKLGAAVKTRVAPQSTAKVKVAQAIKRDEMTPGKIRSRLKELGPQAMIADAGGRNVRSLARATAGVPGPAQNRAEIMLSQRAEGEAGRIAQALKKGLDPQDYYAAEDAFLNNLRTRAAPLYEQAYEKYPSISSLALNRLLKSKTGQKVLRETAEIVENERAGGAAAYLGKVDEELTAAARAAADVGKMEKVGLPGVTRGFSLQTWDQIKRGFDSLLDSPAYRNELTGRLNTRGRTVDKMRRTLLKELDTATGGAKSVFAKARATYSGDAEALRALREGRKALTADPEHIARRIADLSDAGKEAYRSGFARALKDVVDKTVDKGSAASRIFGNTRKRAQIRAAFPELDSYNVLRKSLVAEQQFAQTRRFVHGGSQTTPRAAEAADALTDLAGTAGVILGPKVIQGTHALLAAGIGRKAGKALMGGSPDAHNLAAAKMLFNRNQSMNQQALETLFDPTVWNTLPEKVQRRIGQALLVGAGQLGAAGAAQTPQSNK